MLKINPSRQAEKFLRKLECKQAKQLARKILELRINPSPNDSKQLKGKGLNKYKRADVGEYRIIYRVDDDILYIVVVGKRNDSEVYKIFSRKK